MIKESGCFLKVMAKLHVGDAGVVDGAYEGRGGMRR